MKCLVTGGAGFLGAHIHQALVKLGHDVMVVDDLSGGFKRNIHPKAEYFLYDLERSKLFIEQFAPEVVYHCAANAREGASFFDPSKIVRTNEGAFADTLEGSIKGGKLRKFIFTSSMAVYGGQSPPFDEDTRPEPVDVYGWAKYSIEEMLKLLADCHGFEYTIIRPHNVFGPLQSIKDKYRNVISIFINCIMRGEPIHIYGDGFQLRQYSYIEDSLPTYIRCLDDKANDETINIGGIEEITLNKVASAVKRAMEVPNHPVEYLKDRYGEVKYAYCSHQKSIDLLGYKDSVGWEEGIKRMVAWARWLGPQEWTRERLSIPNDHIPKTWKEEE